MQRLVVATHNLKKLREIEEILRAVAPATSFVRAVDLGLGDPEETGTTFLANALIKAEHAYRHTGLPSLADDSGLAVDHLAGAPGVFSARYAGPGATDADNNRKLVAALAGVPPEARTAAFVATIVLIVPSAMAPALDPALATGALPELGAVYVAAEGRVPGRIIDTPTGPGGFGYDPHFFYVPAGLTFAELPAAAKHAVSHRGQALAALAPTFARLFV